MMHRIQKAKDEDQGFTLIELLVVVIIIGILAAIAIPVFLNQRQSAEDKKMVSDVRNAVTQLETEYTQNNAYPAATLAGFGALVGTEIVQSDGITFGYALAGDTYSICAENSNSSHVGVVTYDSASGDVTEGDGTVTDCVTAGFAALA